MLFRGVDMDAVVFISLAIFYTWKIAFSNESEPETSISDGEVAEAVTDNSNRVAKLNDTFYEDENAFSAMINALGFPRR